MCLRKLQRLLEWQPTITEGTLGPVMAMCIRPAVCLRAFTLKLLVTAKTEPVSGERSVTSLGRSTDGFNI